MKLNKSTVDAIPLTEKGQKIYRDAELIGFARAFVAGISVVLPIVTR
ncbi:hypothetical protein IAF18_17915 [Acinetobacter baumannii]|nr:hypothetical protein [Acinetobacter baumannii]MBD0183414.1 hypothetical protein [Acinetobacter baumannii]